MKQESTERVGKKRGPKEGPPTAPVTVWLEPDLAQWGKAQPGGLSALLRELLRKKRSEVERREKGKAPQAPAPEVLPL